MKLKPNVIQEYTIEDIVEDIQYKIRLQNAEIRRLYYAFTCNKLYAMAFQYDKDTDRYIAEYGSIYEINLNDSDIIYDDDNLRKCEKEGKRIWREFKDDEDDYYIITYDIMEECMNYEEKEYYWKYGDKTEHDYDMEMMI